LKVKVIAAKSYEVVAVMDGDVCPTDHFICAGESTTSSMREGLSVMLQFVAMRGLAGVPSGWYHEASKEDNVYEFIKCALRRFFFKGKGNQIVVCCTGTRKSGKKADKNAVATAAAWRRQYEEASKANRLEVIYEDE